MIDIYYILENYGFFNFIGPFFVVFSLIYGTLRKSRIFGKVKNAEKIYIVISFILTFYYLYSLSTVEYTQRVLSFFFYEILTLLLILIAISFLFTIVTPTGEEKRISSSAISGIFSLIVIIAFLYASLSSPGQAGSGAASFMQNIWDFLITSGLLMVIIPLVIIIIVILWVTTPTKRSKSIKQKAKNTLIVTDTTLDDLFKRLRGEE